jgi:hypothetical protein
VMELTSKQRQKNNTTQLQIRLGHWLVIFLLGMSFSLAQGQSRSVVVTKAKRSFAPPLSHMTSLPPAPLGEDADLDANQVRILRPRSVSVGRDPVLQSEFSALSTLSTTSGVNVLGLGTGFAGYSIQAIVPDTNGAVGTTQFVQFVNRSFEVFDKSGNPLLGPIPGNTLWDNSTLTECSNSPNLDEIVEFDKLANVWVIMMPVFTAPTSLCVAVSTGSDATTSSWNLYDFNTSGVTPDYPKLAVWPDAYYISYNQGVNLAFQGAAACALDRNSMLAGSAATMQCSTLDGTVFGSILPADLDGTTPPPTGTPEYFASFDYDDASIDVWQYHVDWTTPSNSTFTGVNIPVAAFTEPCGETVVQLTYTTGACIPQTGTSQGLDSYGDRLMYRLAYRNFGSYQSLVANHTVSTGNSQTSNTGIRWYELRDTGSGFDKNSVFQSGTYAPDSSYRWMGSIAMDQAGDIALGYSVSDSSISPSLRYTGRVPGDTLGQMETESDILDSAPGGAVSRSSQTGSFHWADYSSIAVDPVDDCTFWFTSEYIPSGGSAWATRIASFKFPSCAPVTPDFSVTPSPSTKTVSAGGSASFDLSLAASGGFSNSVTLSCSAPTNQGVTCLLASTTANPGDTVKLTVTTTAPSAAASLPRAPVPSSPFYAASVCFPTLGLLGIGFAGLRLRSRRLASLLLGSAVLFFVAFETACGGGSNNGGQLKGGTPVGTYTVNISASSGSIQHSSSVTVTVQ